jgi:hypothetical protein
MLRVVRNDERHSRGILASRLCRRVDPDRLGRSFSARRPLNEALGMRRVGGQARPIPGVQPRRGSAVVHVGRRQIPQATVMMRVVVPPEQRVADHPRILDRPETIGKLRPICERRELGFRRRIVVARARARGLAAMPRSVSSSATSLLRIGAPRSAWIVRDLPSSGWRSGRLGGARGRRNVASTFYVPYARRLTRGAPSAE